MALSYGTAARLPTSNGVTTANPAVFAITCPANTGVLWLRIFVAGTTARAGGAPTYNGVAMTAGHAKTNHGGTAEGCGETWYMLNPPTGSSYNISVPNTGARSMALIAATGTKSVGGNSCARENGVNTPGNSTNPTATTPSLTNTCLVFAGVGNGATTWAPSGRTGTQIYDWDAGAYGLGAQYRSGSGALAMGWTFGTSEDWLVQADAFYEVVDTNHELEGNGLTMGAPSLGSPALSQDHTLQGSGLTAGTPSLGSPALSQNHVLVGLGLTFGAPDLGSPALTVQENYELAGLGLDIGPPSLGSPALSQDHVLSPLGLALGPPALGAPALAQDHALQALGLVLGIPQLGVPALSQDHALQPEALMLGAPALGSPALAQDHSLAGLGLDLGTPQLSSPALGGSAHELIGEDLLLGAPELGIPMLAQNHVLIGQALAIGAPELGSPELATQLPPQILTGESPVIHALIGESTVTLSHAGEGPVVLQLVGESQVEEE